MSSAPFLTLNSNRAAKHIIKAMKAKKGLAYIGLQGKLASHFAHMFPNLTLRLFSLASRLIPGAHHKVDLEQGKAITTRYKDAEVPVIREFGEKAQNEGLQHNP
jgi:hypothetical protein